MAFDTREDWLVAALGHLYARYLPDFDMPEVKVSVGWPKGARSGHALGQCFAKQASRDEKTAHIFIAPHLEERIEVLRTLLHELIHAVVGPQEKHKGAFAKLAKRVGFEPPMTSTPPSPQLVEQLGELANALGDYPHVAMLVPYRKQTTRMKLWLCKCGVKIRRAGKLNAQCLDCESKFELQEEI